MGLRIGVPRRQSSELIEPETQRACEDAITAMERAGALIIDVNLPDHVRSRSLMRAIAASELAEAHRDHLRKRPQDYSVEVRESIMQGAFLPATEYGHAQRVRQKIPLDYAQVTKQGASTQDIPSMARFVPEYAPSSPATAKYSPSQHWVTLAPPPSFRAAGCIPAVRRAHWGSPGKGFFRRDLLRATRRHRRLVVEDGV